ncbi:MAG: phage structural protein [Lachnospirales bacterium]
MLFAKYNAKDTTVTVNGVNITGFGEDMLSIEKDEEFFSTSVGAQGDVVKSEINNSLGECNINCAGDKSTVFNADVFSRKQSDPFPFWYTNKSLGERSGGTMANIKNYPEISRGNEAEDVEFEFQIFDLTTERTL